MFDARASRAIPSWRYTKSPRHPFLFLVVHSSLILWNNRPPHRYYYYAAGQSAPPPFTMMSPLSLHSPTILATLLLSSIATAVLSEDCAQFARYKCVWMNRNGVISAKTTTTVFFHVDTEPARQYNATVNFFNNPEGSTDRETVTNSSLYQSNTNNTVAHNFTYTTVGYYQLGYSLTFGEGSPALCNGKTYTHNGWFYFGETGCQFKAPDANSTTTSSTATAAASTTASTAATTTTTTAAPVYTNPAGNEYFCGETFPGILSNCLQKKPCVNGMTAGYCADMEGCFKVTECATQYKEAGRTNGTARYLRN